MNYFVRATLITLLSGAATVGLLSCGGGGGGGTSSSTNASDTMTITPPPRTDSPPAPSMSITPEDQMEDPNPGMNNRPQLLATLQPFYTIVNGSGTVTLTDIFYDPDQGDTLSFSARSSNSRVATARVGGNVLTVFGHAIGSANITVTARDEGGLTTETEFDVFVRSNSSVVIFTITDGCRDTYRIDYRFFSYRSADVDSIEGVWPDANRIFYTAYYNRPYEHHLSCTSGSLVCYGGETSGLYSWGVGIDGDESCNDCCVTCPASGDSIQFSRRLTCN